MKALPLGGALLLATAGTVGHAVAQDPPVSQQAEQQNPLRQEIQQLREELQALRNRSNVDQLRIQELEERLSDLEQARAEGAQPDFPDPAMVPYQEPMITGGTQGNLLNPQITVFLDVLGSVSNDGSNNSLNRFSLREVEVDFRAAIAPFADGVLVAAFGEDIEQMLDGSVDIESRTEVEEGYVDFHTLPGEFALVAGVFRNEFGRNNLLHTHDMPQVDRPLANRAFFGDEGLATAGVSVDRLIPNPWDSYVNLTAQVVNSDSGEDSPVLGGPNAENPAVLGHLAWFQDVGETSHFELGGSYLHGRSGAGSTMDSNTYGVDFMFQWLDPEAADSHSLLVGSEFYWSDIDVDNAFGMFNNNSLGMYAFAQYQFDLSWYGGVRYDYTEFPNSDLRGPDDEDWAISPYISWYITEYLRLRFEYQHLERDISGSDDEEEIFFLQLTAAFGSHPPHPYWVNR